MKIIMSLLAPILLLSVPLMLILAAGQKPRKDTRKLFDQLVQERGMFCEECRFRPATEMHHAILRRSIKHPEYDCPENLELVCHECHSSGRLDTFDHSVKFWRRQKERGYDMDGWIKSLNLKTREFYD